jgi:hypothetical protein
MLKTAPRCLVVTVLVALVASCSRPTVPELATPHEPASSAELATELPLAEQIAAVEAGRSTQILVAEVPLTDDDLAALADLTGLTDLLVDHPDSRITAAGIAHLPRLPALTHLRIRGPGLDDAAIDEIVRLKSLLVLNLPRGSFTDAGLARLAELPELVQLRFHSPAVTDAGIAQLAKFPSLLRLHLIDVQISEVGLAALAAMPELETLYLDGGNLSDQAWDDFFAKRKQVGYVHVHINQHHHDRDPDKHEH